MTNLWLLYCGFPLIVLGARLMILRNSLVRARRAGQASIPSLQIPWREGLILAVAGVIALAVGFPRYLLASHEEMWVIINAGALLLVLGMGQLIQALAQRLPAPKRLKSECLVCIGACIVAIIGFVFIIAYVFAEYAI